MKTVVIGGGPAGMMAAISAKKSGSECILLEKNSSLGKKLLITGKGRCNITSSYPMDEFISNIPGNGKFLFSCFSEFTNEDILSLLEKHGLKAKEERGHRYFPVTDRSQSVLDCFIEEIKELNIDVRTKQEVVEIKTQNNEVVGVYLSSGELINCSKVILATGGKSYPITGSDGNGYKLATKLGHTLVEPQGSIIPMLADSETCSKMQGLSLRNVGINIYDEQNNKHIYEDFGEMLFTHFGVSGPTILSASAHLIRYKDIDRLFNENKIKLYIDLKPALNREELDKRILRDFDEFKNKEFKNSLEKLLPKKIIPVVIEKTGIIETKKINEITHEERQKLVDVLKKFEVTLKGFRPIEEAIITAGGISIKEINPKTMESKIVKGLYFAGEIIDVDAYTGGFNLQIAYSTGFVAGKY